jgi:hypothetical protein
MGDKKNTQIKPALDDEYKDAIKAVADDNMRTDILGPHFCRVLENHTPASEAIILLVTKKVGSDPEFKKSIKEVIKEHNKETKMKWVDRAIGAGGVIILSLIIWGLQQFLSAPHTS